MARAVAASSILNNRAFMEVGATGSSGINQYASRASNENQGLNTSDYAMAASNI